MELEQITQPILYIILILVFAKVFGELAERIGQPPVLGELVGGVVLAATVFKWMHVQASENLPLLVLAELGVILLLFEVGLESDLEEFLRVGPSAFMVAVVGVAGPFAAGYFGSLLFDLPHTTAVFIGATLTATSVGITARTLTDMGQLRTSEAKIILGAAVIDDVMGLIILAVVTGLVMTGSTSAWQIGQTTALAIAFLVGAILIGVPVAPHLLNIAKKLRTRGILTISAFLFCLALSYLAHEVKLATIVGAFAAGLVLARTEDLAHIQERIKPVADILVPIFFVMVGIRVDLDVINPLNPQTKGTLAFMGMLIAVAVVMKLFAGLGVLRRNVNRIIVGVGMIPRGEVGLIFATIGLTGKIITPGEYAIIITVVVITTFITPPLLKLAFRGKTKQASGAQTHAESG